MQRKEEYGARVGHWLRTRGKKESSRMSLTEKKMYEKIFDLFDADGSGALDFEEISVALRLVGLDARHLQRDIEENSNEEGELDFPSFLHVIDASFTHTSAHDKGPAKKDTDMKVPFNLLLPSFSRKKNVEFVMALSPGPLPYPLDAKSFMSKDKTTTTKPELHNVAPAACPVCRHPPTKLLEIAKAL